MKKTLKQSHFLMFLVHNYRLNWIKSAIILKYADLLILISFA